MSLCKRLKPRQFYYQKLFFTRSHLLCYKLIEENKMTQNLSTHDILNDNSFRQS
jgi:hypothetical protein